MKKDNFEWDSLPDIEEKVLESFLQSENVSLFAKHQIAKRIENIQKKRRRKAKNQ